MNSSTFTSCFISTASRSTALVSKGNSTWVVKRWYWTVENSFEFEGKPATTVSTE